MTRARALAVLLATLAIALTTSIGGGATALADTCTTSTSAARVQAFDTPFADACATAQLVATPNPAAPDTVVRLDGSQSDSDDDGNAIATYVWDFGDRSGDETAAPLSSTTHQYARGRWTATLTLEDAGGDELASDSEEVVVSELPVARLAVPAGILRPGVEYAFDATGSTAPGGSIDHYEWDFGDGATAQTATPVVAHTFARDGVSTAVSVVVVNDLSLDSAPARGAVTVANQLPLVQLLAAPATVAVGQTLTLDATGSTDPDGSVRRFDWDLDANGSFETSTGLTPTVRAGGYPNPGIIVPRVRVVDDSGAGSVKGIVVTVTGSGGAGGGGEAGGGARSGGGSGSGSGGNAGAGTGTGSGGGGGSGADGGAAGSGDAPFAVGLGGTAIQRLNAALRRGVGLTASANRAASGTLTLSVSAADARTLGLPGRRGRRPVTIGTLQLSLRAGRTAKPSIKLKARARTSLSRAKPRTLRVTIRGSLAAGAASAAVVRVVLLRG